MLPGDIYSQAHLFVAATRVFEYLNNQPPSLRGLRDLLQVSEEELSRISRRLEEAGAIQIIMSGGEARFSLRDHLKIEEFPRSMEAPRMEEEISLFKTKQESRLKEIEQSLSKKGDKSSIFSELEKALKDPSSVKKKNPLD
jgi:DNA-binding transcriptional regulator GbsR (MarR family)